MRSSDRKGLISVLKQQILQQRLCPLHLNRQEHTLNQPIEYHQPLPLKLKFYTSIEIYKKWGLVYHLVYHNKNG